MRLPVFRIPAGLALNTGSLYIGDERCFDNVHVDMIAIYGGFVHIKRDSARLSLIFSVSANAGKIPAPACRSGLRSGYFSSSESSTSRILPRTISSGR